MNLKQNQYSKCAQDQSIKNTLVDQVHVKLKKQQQLSKKKRKKG